MNIALLNGKPTYIHRVAPQRGTAKRAVSLAEEFHAALLAEEASGKYSRPANAPVPTECKCGRVFAGGGRRKLCFECHDAYTSELMKSPQVCGGCGKTFAMQRKDQITCGAIACKVWRRVTKED
jgi:hypothetical protein